MSIYAKLADILEAQAGDSWKVSFSELERLLDQKLPSSAFKYAGWWSNNPSNNAMTKIWLMAGWRTEKVDVPGQTVVFRRNKPPAPAYYGRPLGFEMAMAGPFETKMAKPPVGGRKVRFEELHGAMRGTIRIMPDVDVTAPLDADGPDAPARRDPLKRPLPKRKPSS